MTDAITTAEQPTALRRRHHPFLVFGLRVALVLVLVVGAAELLLRTPAVVERLPPPSAGSGSPDLDIKIEYLDRYAQAYGHIDCLFVGPSTVQGGIDPRVVSASFAARTGTPLRCFNFGVNGLKLHLARRLIPVLLAKYQPALIVLSEWRSGTGADSLTWFADQHPWVGYFNGAPSINGWLMEHSRLLRYFLRVKGWMEQPALSRRISKKERRIQPTGFMPKPAMDASSSPGRNRRLAAWALRQMTAQRVATQTLAELAQQPTMPPMLLLEMPLPGSFRAEFPNGEAGYQALLADVEAVGLPLLRSSGYAPLPDSAWNDPVHLNDRGAYTFSLWLGAALADLAREGRIPVPMAGNGVTPDQ